MRKKFNLPDNFWLWKPKRGDPSKAKFGGEIGVMRWNDVTKTKIAKFVSMMSTFHSFELVDSNKKDRHIGEVIKKPDVIIDYNKTMGGENLVSWVLIPYSSQRRGVKWYRKLAKLYIYIAVYNSFIIYKKLNGGSKIDHFNFLKMLIEELIMFHASGGSSYSTGPNLEPSQENFVRLVERQFISQIPSTVSKPKAQRKCVRYTKLGIRRDTRFWSRKCNVALCLNKCFEIYHTMKDITHGIESDSEYESD